MREYELTLVLALKSTAAKKKAVQDFIGKVVDLAKGKVGKVEDWGEKETGIYLHFPLELTAEGAKTLKSKVAQEAQILKHLLIRKNK